jgi:hypothetical protein
LESSIASKLIHSKDFADGILDRFLAGSRATAGLEEPVSLVREVELSYLVDGSANAHRQRWIQAGIANATRRPPQKGEQGRGQRTRLDIPLGIAVNYLFAGHDGAGLVGKIERERT